MNIRCIVFDVGWTLVDETEAHRHRMGHLLKACDPGAGLTVDRLMEMYEESASEHHGDPLMPLLDRLGVSRERRNEFPYGKSMERVYPDASPALQILKKNFKLGVLANQSPGLPGRIGQYGWDGLFDFVIGSGDVGLKKPQKEIYELAEKTSGCRPSEILMVGDRLDNDIAPAKTAGWRTARILRGIHRRKKPEGSGEVPDMEAESLDQLARMLIAFSQEKGSREQPGKGAYDAVADYNREGVAAQYDADRGRWKIGPLEAIGRRLAITPSWTVSVLDVGCGTGLWLDAQSRHYEGKPVRWVGLDPSPGMLAVARGKVAGVELVEGRAERLPFDEASFDVLVSNFAFHHFADKAAAIAEMARVLKPGGTIRLVNMDPWSQPGWAVYIAFPGTRDMDMERFWPVDRITDEFKRHGLASTADVTRTVTPTPVTEILAEAEQRKCSQLLILDAAAFERGISALRKEIADGANRVVQSEFALLTLTAIRK